MHQPLTRTRVREHVRSVLHVLLVALAVWLSLALQDLLFGGAIP